MYSQIGKNGVAKAQFSTLANERYPFVSDNIVGNSK